MKLEFRKLRADEISARVQSVKANGLVLLLYKDARCDQTILDETVGPMNWQRHHLRDNMNCVVSIWDEEKKQWVEKEDTGTESNTEAEKGLASDSFKRACFNWGIGRELYTSPFIWIGADKCNIQNGKCYDTFTVTDIDYDGNTISRLEIYNDKTKATAFSWRKSGAKKPAAEPKKENDLLPTIYYTCEECGKRLEVYKDPKGNDVPIRKHVESSKKKFGRVLCLECIARQKAINGG